MLPERPLTVGLTGSIGMGKTESARLFARLGIPVHHADAAVHRFYEAGGVAVGPIAAAFPGCVRNGRVDRTCLAQRLAGDSAAFARLEAIVHPLVAADQKAFIDEAAKRGADIVVFDVPLLFETGADARMDAVVVVTAPAEVQRARVLAREGMSEDALDHILARQLPDVDKRARANFVVETDKGFDHAFHQVESIVSSLRGRREGRNA